MFVSSRLLLRCEISFEFFLVGSGSLCFVGSGTSLRHEGKAGCDSATLFLFISSKVLNILKSTKRQIGPDIWADMCPEIIISSSLWIQWVELVEYMDTYMFCLNPTVVKIVKSGDFGQYTLFSDF